MTTDLLTPVIGITMDWNEAGEYSKFPWYALRQNHVTSVVRAGGLPFLLTHEPDLLELYLNDIDGLIVSGGAFDISPAMYGESGIHETTNPKESRTAAEMTLLEGALEMDIPILGICGGHQLLHVALGGSLIQHVPDEASSDIAHEQENPRNEIGHTVNVVPGTLLHDIVGTDEISVNSAHHQAAKDEPATLIINARAPDGVIEGIEAREQAFCLGVQWHPEFEITESDTRIFAAFVEAARGYARDREQSGQYGGQDE